MLPGRSRAGGERGEAVGAPRLRRLGRVGGPPRQSLRDRIIPLPADDLLIFPALAEFPDFIGTWRPFPDRSIDSG